MVFHSNNIPRPQPVTEDRGMPDPGGKTEKTQNHITGDLSYAIRSSSARLIRLDTLSDTELEARCRFPASADEALSDSTPNIPVSAEPELFAPEQIRRFIDLAKARVGEIDLGLYLVEQDITCIPSTDSRFSQEATFRNQALHSVTAFDYKGQRMCGPFCGSAAKYVLMHCKDKLPPQDLIPATRALLHPLINSFASFTVAFPDRQIFKPQNSTTVSQDFDLARSPTFQLLCGDPIHSTVFKPAMPGRDGGPSSRDHLYYYSGPERHLLEAEFTGILHAIRAARDEVAGPIRSRPEFKEALAKREQIARDYIRRLILPFD